MTWSHTSVSTIYSKLLPPLMSIWHILWCCLTFESLRCHDRNLMEAMKLCTTLTSKLYSSIQKCVCERAPPSVSHTAYGLTRLSSKPVIGLENMPTSPSQGPCSHARNREGALETCASYYNWAPLLAAAPVWTFCVYSTCTKAQERKKKSPISTR